MEVMIMAKANENGIQIESDPLFWSGYEVEV